MQLPGRWAIFVTFRDCQGWRPLITKNIQTDTAIRVDVGMVDTSGEVDLRGFEWVVCWEVDGEEENSG